MTISKMSNSMSTKIRTAMQKEDIVSASFGSVSFMSQFDNQNRRGVKLTLVLPHDMFNPSQSIL